jgi:hypothetical protein
VSLTPEQRQEAKGLLVTLQMQGKTKMVNAVRHDLKTHPHLSYYWLELIRELVGRDRDW